MKKNLKIYLARPSQKIPSKYIQDGKIWLDLPIDFDLSETLTPDKLDTLQSLQANYAVSSALAKSDKNRFIFAAYGDSNIDILMIAGSRILEFKQLIYIKESAQGFEVSFISDNPLVKIKDSKMNEIEVGNFDFSIPNMLLSFANDLADPTKVAYFPVCDYGAWHDTATVDKSVFPQDLRPFFKEYELMKRIFCQLTGYSFKSEIHEKGTVYGNYILANEFKGVQFGAKMVIDADVRTAGDLLPSSTRVFINTVLKDDVSVTKNYNSFDFTEVGYDNGVTSNGYFNNATKEIIGISGKYHFKINVWAQNNIAFRSGVQVCVYVNENAITPTTTPFWDVIIAPNNTFNQTIIDSIDFNFLATDIIEIRFKPVSLNVASLYDVTLGAASSIELVAVSVQPTPTYFEQMSKFINGSIKCVDYLKGIAHGVNGSFAFDHVNRFVTLLSQTGIVNLHGTNETIKGYYNDNQVDLRPLLICDSENIEQLDSELTRLQTWKYKESSDPFLSKNVNFGSYTTDLGDTYKDGETTSENPFFEPTITRQDHPLFKGVSIYPIAVLRDNEDGRRSFAIAPRRVILQNGTPFGADGVSNYWSFFGTMQQNSMPVCYMLPTIPYNGVQTYANVMYGGARYSIFETFYKKWLNQQKNGIKISLLVWLNSAAFQKISLRNSYIIQIKGKPIVAHIQEVKDHKITSQLPTPITFTPIKIDYSC